MIAPKSDIRHNHPTLLKAIVTIELHHRRGRRVVVVVWDGVWQVAELREEEACDFYIVSLVSYGRWSSS